MAPRVHQTPQTPQKHVSSGHLAHVAHVENSTCARRLEHHVRHVAAHIPPHSVPSKSPFWRGAPFSPPPIVPHVGRGLPDTSRHLGHVGIGIFKQRIFSLSCLRTQLWLQDANAQALCCLVGAQPLFWFSSSNLRGLAPWDIPIRCVSAGTADGGAFCCSASSLVHPLVTIACTPTLQLFHGSLRGRCLDTVYTIDLVEAPCERTHV